MPLAGEATAGAYITTDLDDNQIVGFHPGAMDRAHEAGLERVKEPIDVAHRLPERQARDASSRRAR